MQQRNTYLYHFARTGNVAIAGHFAEVAYAFQNCASCGVADPTFCCQANGQNPVDLAIMRAMGEFWTSFAATGQPTATAVEEWPRYTRSADTAMRFDASIRTEVGWRKEYCDFWKQFPLPTSKPGRNVSML